MPAAAELRALDPELDEAVAPGGGTVSVWCGRPGRPADYARHEHVLHYAASTMKIAVMLAAFRRHAAGDLDLDRAVRIDDHFRSVHDGSPFTVTREDDNDEKVWAALGTDQPLRWLIERMIVRSSNLATNLVLDTVGTPAVAAALDEAGVSRMRVCRGIQDAAARDHGLDNEVTAHDLAVLLSGLAEGRFVAPDACEQMLAVLRAQEYADKIRAGLPPGTVVANKDGWVEGISHDAALISPPDAEPYVLVVCCTGVDEATGQRLCARIAAASWAGRAEPPAGAR